MTHKVLTAGLATLALTCGTMLLWSVPAPAAIVHEYEREIGQSSIPSPPGPLTKPFLSFGVAVDNSTGASAGDVYVSDFENGAVDKFGPLGEYVSQLTGFTNPWGVAVDNSASPSAEGGVYIADYGNGNVYREKSALVSGLTGVTGVAVDQATGDVYVARGESEAARHSEENLVYEFDSSDKELPPLEGFGRPTAVAVDNMCYYAGLTGSACMSADPSNGDVYVLDDGFGETTTPHVDKFEVEATGKLKLLLQWPAEGFGLAVDQSTGNVYATNQIKKLVGEEFVEESFVAEFNATGKLLSQIGESSPHYPTQARAKKFSPVSVSIDRVTGGVYIGDVGNGVVDLFGPPFESPEAFTGPFSSLGSTGVTLEGEVNPKHSDTTSFFEYGACAKPTCTDEKGKPELYGPKQSTIPPDNGSGVGNLPVRGLVSGLVPNQAYHYLLAAKNKHGESTERIEKQFTTPATPPKVETSQPSFVGFEAAALSGSVNPEHSDTTYRYEYGLCAEPAVCAVSKYTGVTPSQKSAIYGAVNASQEIEGLRPSSTYHYRLVAENQACPEGETHPCPIPGSEETFTTEGAPALVVVTGAASGAAQTAAMVSGALDPNGLASNYGFQIGTQAGVYGPEVGIGRLEPGVLEARTVTFALQNLRPGTAYHYRLVASNAYNATVYGGDETFTTAVASSPFTLLLAPPLLASPSIAFPTESKVKNRASKCKRGYKRDKHGKCVRSKKKRKKAGRASRRLTALAVPRLNS
jgi:hypothetical protein